MPPLSSAPQSSIETPCIGVCLIDASGLCAGCARTLKEIGAWGMLSPSARLGILEQLAARKATVASDSSRH